MSQRDGKMSKEGLAYWEALCKVWAENKPQARPGDPERVAKKEKSRKRTMWPNYRMGPNAKLDRYRDE